MSRISKNRCKLSKDYQLIQSTNKRERPDIFIFRSFKGTSDKKSLSSTFNGIAENKQI